MRLVQLLMVMMIMMTLLKPAYHHHHHHHQPPTPPPPPPPDILFAPVPGKRGGDGALDAGKGGNPSGAPPPRTHSLINTFLSPARISRRPRLCA